MGHGVSIPNRLLRTASAVLFVCLFASCCVVRADKPVKVKKENRRAESHEIESLEQTWLRALMKGDTAVLEKLMSDDFLAISANGNLSDKTQYLQRVSSGTNAFRSIDIMDIKVRVQPSSAVVVSQVRIVGQLDSRPVNGIFRYTKVYGRAPGGQWHVLNLEATRVSDVNPDGSDMHPGMPLNGHPNAHPISLK